VISSFFKPAVKPPKRAPSDSEVLILDDSSDDELPPPSTRNTAKRVKLEHDGTAAAPLASTSSTGLVPTSSRPPASTSASFSKPTTSSKVSRWRFDPTAVAQSYTAAPFLSQADASRRDAFANKLLGRNLLQKKIAYLQEDHYMSPNAQASGSRSAGGPIEVDDEDRVDNDDDDEDDDEPVGKGKGKATSKGKGSTTKGKGEAKEDEVLSTSRFVKFAAKGGRVGSNGKDSSKIKYTPL
jgi:hypothetical protein